MNETITPQRFDAANAGRHLVVFGAIHGNEVCGAKALNKLVHELTSGALKLERGSLTVVAVCNPEAFAQNKRFIEDNLNRVFEQKTAPHAYERKLAQKLMPVIESGDAFLDLHSMTSEGEPFAVLNGNHPESIALCEALGTDILLSGWPELYAKLDSEVPSSCTQDFADLKKIPNALIECGQHGDPAAVEVAYRAVRGALDCLGILGCHIPMPKPKRRIHFTEVIFKKTAHDRLAREWKNFDPLKKGNLIAHMGPDQVPALAPHDGRIVFPFPEATIGAELYYLAVEN